MILDVNPQSIAARIKAAAFVKDYRLFKLDKNSYRILILPEPEASAQDKLSIKGAVLDALVDLFGMKCSYDIDIIEEDEDLQP